MAHGIVGGAVVGSAIDSGHIDLHWNVLGPPALPLEMTEAMMTGDKKTEENPDLKEVEPGSDADASPAPKIGETPPSPNGNETEDEKEE